MTSLWVLALLQALLRKRAFLGCSSEQRLNLAVLFITTSAVCSRETGRVLLWLAAFLWCNSRSRQSIACTPRAWGWIVTAKVLGIKKKKKRQSCPKQNHRHSLAFEGTPREPALFCRKLSGQACLHPNSLATQPSSHFQSRSFQTISAEAVPELVRRPRLCSGGEAATARCPLARRLAF